MTGNPRRGVVLVTVLWSIALLSALAMAASATFRGFAGIMAVDRDRLQADALLTAGLEGAAARIATAPDRPLADGETAVALSTGVVRARFSDEGGRIDIGKAPAEVLASLLRSVGAPPAAANDVAQRIVDLRNPAGAPAQNVAARKPAQPAGKPATDPPFTDVLQLAQVPGMSPQWLGAMAGLVTVFGSETVNPLTAPPRVLAALPGVDGGRLESFLALRRGSPADAERLIAAFGPAQRFLEAKSQRVAAVELTATLADGYAAAARAVIVALPQDSQPYRVLMWKPLPSSMVR